ncbi:MAG: glycosyltransferase family 39 protein [bacterium]|nr:glycosyltransferase family 39 protein [bacterium]
MNRRDAWLLGLVLVVATLLLGVRFHSVPLLDPDESRFARTSVEMLRTGDVVVPQFQGRPRLVKPPLMHWIQSRAFAVFGATEWVARLHALLATLGTVALVAWIGRRRFGDEGALWAAACCATMPLVLVPGRLGTLDALLALHVLAAVALDMGTPGEPPRFRAPAFGALTGLAFLIKGPVGVVVPLLILLAGRTVTGRDVLPSARAAAAGVAAWSAVVLPWSLALLSRMGGATVWATLRGESLDRYVGGEVHVKPFWFYGLVLLVGCFPWCIAAAFGLYRVVAERRIEAAPTARYAAAALVVCVGFFSLSPSKLPTYVLPLAPLVALLVAWEIGRQIASPATRPWGPRAIAAGLALASGALAVAGATRLDEPAPRLVALAAAAAFGAAAAAAALGAGTRRPRITYAAAGSASAVFLFLVVWILFPAIAQTRTSAYLIDSVPELRAGRPLVLVDMRVPSMTYYLDRVPELVDMPGLNARLDREDSPLFVFDEVDLPNAPAGALERLEVVGSQGKYVVYDKRPPKTKELP